MRQPCTTFVGNNNPFTGAPLKAATTPKTVRQRIPPDVASMRIVSDPVPANFSRGRDKYGALFEQLKPGQAVACLPAEVSAVAYALRKWLLANKRKCVVSQTNRYGADNQGRVWMLPVKDDSYADPAPTAKRKGGK